MPEDMVRRWLLCLHFVEEGFPLLFLPHLVSQAIWSSETLLSLPLLLLLDAGISDAHHQICPFHKGSEDQTQAISFILQELFQLNHLPEFSIYACLNLNVLTQGHAC